LRTPAACKLELPPAASPESASEGHHRPVCLLLPTRLHRSISLSLSSLLLSPLASPIPHLAPRWPLLSIIYLYYLLRVPWPGASQPSAPFVIWHQESRVAVTPLSSTPASKVHLACLCTLLQLHHLHHLHQPCRPARLSAYQRRPPPPPHTKVLNLISASTPP
jgi:hypothetical protein